MHEPLRSQAQASCEVRLERAEEEEGDEMLLVCLEVESVCTRTRAG